MKKTNSSRGLAMATKSKLQDTNLIFQLAKELKKYLQEKLKKGEDGIYCCSSSDPNDWSRCWEKTRQFCRRKELDYDVFMEVFENMVDMFNCESNIPNELDLGKLKAKMGIDSVDTGKEDEITGNP